MTVRAFSFGGGVQSTACLVLATQGEIDFPTFIFANTGEDSENPDTLIYVEKVAKPYADSHGIQLVEVRRRFHGERITLVQELRKRDSSCIIPVRMSNGAPGNRRCTYDFKIMPIAQWMRSAGATKQNPGVMGLGISLDEMQRMRTSTGQNHYTAEYPLVDLRIDRSRCISIIRGAGLPVPPKSSCFFCPYHGLNQWRELRDRRPDLFDRAAEIEDTLNGKRQRAGKDNVWLTDACKPLKQAVGTGVQPALFEDSCESGYCMT